MFINVLQNNQERDEDGEIYINASVKVASYDQAMGILRTLSPSAKIQEYRWIE